MSDAESLSRIRQDMTIGAKQGRSGEERERNMREPNDDDDDDEEEEAIRPQPPHSLFQTAGFLSLFD